VHWLGERAGSVKASVRIVIKPQQIFHNAAVAAMTEMKAG